MARGGGGYLDRTLEPSPQRAERPQTTLKLGGLTLKGPWAILALVVLVLVCLALAIVIWSHPSLKMLLSAALWVAFVVYWSVTARGAAPTRSSESDRSRALHQNLMATIAFAYWRKIRLEERSLHQVFGAACEAYARESWALVPWVL